jgi:hypothetical protein
MEITDKQLTVKFIAPAAVIDTALKTTGKITGKEVPNELTLEHDPEFHQVFCMALSSVLATHATFEAVKQEAAVNQEA